METTQEYKKEREKSLFRGWKIIFIWLLISSVKVSNDGIKNRYTVRQFNPYNPLSYIIAIPMLFIAIFMQGVPDTINQVKEGFKYR